ncbi:hypothetical protein RJ640_011521 [Escallonia rubra]|uniref:FAE domain-containing protein n=1 Tax=Escallonia rubra TaxID=112253 RepID=A0AA88SBV9_9ASTE|nr:hypothetical protein RJ640_011521 [Escallonia rubra]
MGSLPLQDEKITKPEPRPFSVRLKYVKLGYHHLVTPSTYKLLVPLLAIVSVHILTLNGQDFLQICNHLKFNLASVILCSALAMFLATVNFMSRPRKVYLVDFTCYKPDADLMCSKEKVLELSSRVGIFTEENIAFQRKILERSGLGQKTYLSEALMQSPPNPCLVEAKREAEMVMFGAIDGLLAKTGVKVKDIGILVVNTGVFNPMPSLSAMVVNHYNLRSNVLSYNLVGMGCSAGIISIHLAKHLLQDTNSPCSRCSPMMIVRSLTIGFELKVSSASASSLYRTISLSAGGGAGLRS